ncbi:MAG: hypothetical protein AAF380_00720 [Bacteroidota bacterium]
MCNIRTLTFFIFIYTPQIALTKPPKTHNFSQKQIAHISYIIKEDRIVDKGLEKVLQNIITNQPIPKLSKKLAEHILSAAIEEQNTYILKIVDFLLTYFQSKNIPFSKHLLMQKALKKASTTTLISATKPNQPILAQYQKEETFKLVNYLLKNKIYKQNQLLAQAYKIPSRKLDWLHIVYILFSEINNVRFLPSFIVKTWGTLSTLINGFMLVAWLLTIPFSITNFLFGLGSSVVSFLLTPNKAISYYMDKYLFFLRWYWIATFYLLRVVIVLYRARAVSYKPGYLFHLFKNIENKNKNAVEALALLLLENGAKPNAKALFITKKSMPEIPITSQYHYTTLSILHQATKHDMQHLTKALVKLGANVNTIGNIGVNDQINFPLFIQIAKTSQDPKISIWEKINMIFKIFKVFKLITIKHLKKQNKGQKVTPLDLAPINSTTAHYLTSQSAKPYRKIQPKKNTKSKT